jgi:hypothetical protein
MGSRFSSLKQIQGSTKDHLAVLEVKNRDPKVVLTNVVPDALDAALKLVIAHANRRPEIRAFLVQTLGLIPVAEKRNVAGCPVQASLPPPLSSRQQMVSVWLDEIFKFHVKVITTIRAYARPRYLSFARIASCA